MNNYQPILLTFYRRECLRKRMRKDVGHLKPKQKSGVSKCCSDWFILQGEQFRSEKVGMDSTFSQRIIRCELSSMSTSAHIFRTFAAKNLLGTKKFVPCKSGFKHAKCL